MKINGWAAAALGMLACVAVPACGSDHVDGGYPGAVSGGGGFAESCRQFASCESCTPVSGCGWCFDSNGVGECAPDPDSCGTPAFSWTWNASGCRVPADAGRPQVSQQEDAGPTVIVDAGPVPVDAELVDVELGTADDGGVDGSFDAGFLALVK